MFSANCSASQTRPSIRVENISNTFLEAVSDETEAVPLIERFEFPDGLETWQSFKSISLSLSSLIEDLTAFNIW